MAVSNARKLFINRKKAQQTRNGSVLDKHILRAMSSGFLRLSLVTLISCKRKSISITVPKQRCIQNTKKIIMCFSKTENRKAVKVTSQHLKYQDSPVKQVLNSIFRRRAYSFTCL